MITDGKHADRKIICGVFHTHIRKDNHAHMYLICNGAIMVALRCMSPKRQSLCWTMGFTTKTKTKIMICRWMNIKKLFQQNYKNNELHNTENTKRHQLKMIGELHY